jgi:hypothetical protein
MTTHNPANLLVTPAGSRPETAERAQLSASLRRSSDNSSSSTPSAAHWSAAQPPTARCIGSIPISQLARGAQIPIAPAEPPHVPQARFPPLEAFGRRPPNSRPRHSCGQHPKTFTVADFSD